MSRPWQVWLAFSSGLLAAVAALAWLSYRAIESERADAEATRRVAQQELARLALWRLDSAAATLLAQENARPLDAYRPFLLVDGPAGGKSSSKPSAPKVVPSQLLMGNTLVRLYFTVDSQGDFHSPSVPPRELLSSVVPKFVSALEVADRERQLAALPAIVSPEQLLTRVPTISLTADEEPVALAIAPPPNPAPNPPLDPFEQTSQQAPAPQSSDFVARSQLVAQSALNVQTQNRDRAASGTQVSVMTPFWQDGQLLLARRAREQRQESVQGCWIDWQALQSLFLAAIRDLLPDAQLVPTGAISGSESMKMAVLPIGLVPGDAPLPVVRRSPLHFALLAIWGSLALAALIIGWQLRGVLALSERRAAFVSAVTHELRTPLTTFRMYADMLAEGMVPDESTRVDYLRTLRREADRLTHLVENVLAYARLERGGLSARIQPMAVGKLLQHAGERLSGRAAQAGCKLLFKAKPDVLHAKAIADPAAVEQILFNLVDNACKYGQGAQQQPIELHVKQHARTLALEVRDRGPGVPERERRRLFQPFRKSARDAAHSAPGVGLGLALSRRLARDMGGDLTLDTRQPEGACFVLTLKAEEVATRPARQA